MNGLDIAHSDARADAEAPSAPADGNAPAGTDAAAPAVLRARAGTPTAGGDAAAPAVLRALAGTSTAGTTESARPYPSRAVHPPAPAWDDVFRALPLAALVFGSDGRVAACNAAALDAIGPLAQPGARCCDLFGCGLPGRGLDGGCVTRRARSGGLAERRVRLDDGEPVWLAAAALAGGIDVVVMLRPAEPGAGGDAERGVLRLITLGRTRLEQGGGTVEPDWLGHRPGLVLKYLVSERGRVVPLEELLEVFWPGAGRGGAASVRQAVHTLRDRLEPGRTRGLPSPFVVARHGGYMLDAERVRIDADAFESRARAGLQALAGGAAARAEAALGEAAAAYTGDFLADEPYVEWALPERQRLRDLAAEALRELAALRRAAGDLAGTGAHLQRLADLEPLDLAAQRALIASMLERGRHSEAFRRFELVRHRYKRAFGEEPGFSLADVAAG